MATFKLTALIASACVMFSACGGGGDDSPPPASTPASSYSNLVVVGNSIAASGLNPMWADWTGPVRGMAASTPETDFVHVAATALALPVEVTGGVDIEIRPETVTQADIDAKLAAVGGTTALVVELGDNALTDNLVAFRAGYATLLETGKRAQRLVCLSTWWGNTATDAVMRDECTKVGGKYVFIGDIWKDPANRDLLDGPQFTDPGVQAHPHDWGMRVIGLRVAAALK